jgi:N-acetylglucosaminyl-diphospho-decaprenol L-rhamnosyltransferase
LVEARKVDTGGSPLRPARTVAGQAVDRCDVLVSVVNHHHVDLLPACLDSVRASRGVTVKLAVLDNASPDGSAEMVRRRYPDAELIAQRQAQGFAANQNTVIAPRLDTARYILLFNDDACLEGDALATLVRFMDGHARAGIAGARMVYPDGSPQVSYGAFPTPLDQLFYLWGLGRLLPKRWRRRVPGAAKRLSRLLPPMARAHLDNWFTARSIPIRVDWVAGCCMIVRPETIAEIGLLDANRYPMYFEDVDWCRRAAEAGWDVWFVPEARVRHHQGASSGAAAGRAWAQGAVGYFARHGSARDVAVVRAGVIARSVIALALFGVARVVAPWKRARLESALERHRDVIRVARATR